MCNPDGAILVATQVCIIDKVFIVNFLLLLHVNYGKLRRGRGTKDGGHAENVLVVSLQFRSPSGG